MSERVLPNIPPAPCCSPPGVEEPPQGQTPLLAKIVPCPSLHKVTVRPGAGWGPALTRAPRELESGAAVVGGRAVGKKGPWGPAWGFLLLPGGRRAPVSPVLSKAPESLGDPVPAQQTAWDAGEEQSLQCVCLRGVNTPGTPCPSWGCLDVPGQIIPRAAPLTGAGSPSRGWIPIPGVNPHRATPTASILPGSMPPSPSCRGHPPMGSHLPALPWAPTFLLSQHSPQGAGVPAGGGGKGRGLALAEAVTRRAGPRYST